EPPIRALGEVADLHGGAPFPRRCCGPVVRVVPAASVRQLTRASPSALAASARRPPRVTKPISPPAVLRRDRRRRDRQARRSAWCVQQNPESAPALGA